MLISCPAMSQFSLQSRSYLVHGLAQANQSENVIIKYKRCIIAIRDLSWDCLRQLISIYEEIIAVMIKGVFFWCCGSALCIVGRDVLKIVKMDISII